MQLVIVIKEEAANIVRNGESEEKLEDIVVGEFRKVLLRTWAVRDDGQVLKR